MNEWMQQARADLAQAVGDLPASIPLSQTDIDQILELARVAAHESGERPTAPVVTYLAGIVRGRHPETDLSDLVDAVVKRTPEG
jgi:hypothetical protein